MDAPAIIYVVILCIYCRYVTADRNNKLKLASFSDEIWAVVSVFEKAREWPDLIKLWTRLQKVCLYISVVVTVGAGQV